METLDQAALFLPVSLFYRLYMGNLNKLENTNGLHSAKTAVY